MHRAIARHAVAWELPLEKTTHRGWRTPEQAQTSAWGERNHQVQFLLSKPFDFRFY
jgi:hypothetical protein